MTRTKHKRRKLIEKLESQRGLRSSNRFASEQRRRAQLPILVIKPGNLPKWDAEEWARLSAKQVVSITD